MEPHTIRHDGYTITTDKEQMKLGDIHRWLSEEAYWSKGIAYDRVKPLLKILFALAPS